MNTVYIKYLFRCLLLCIALASCSDDTKETVTPMFEMSETDLQQDFKQLKSFVSIPVKTSLDATHWSVCSNAEWCKAAQSFSASEASILIEVNPNEEVEVRTTTIDIQSSVNNYVIEVRQLGIGKAILLKDAAPVLDAAGGKLAVTVTANVEYTIEVGDECNWLTADASTRAMVEHNHSFSVLSNPLYEKRSADITFTAKADAEVKAICRVSQKAKVSDMDDVQVEGDTQLIPTSGKASEHQSGYNIEKSFDGKPGTHYHSTWGQSTKFPVSLEYFFEDAKTNRDVDYIIYRTRSGNGNFGQFDLYVATEEAPEYQLYGSYDFRKQNTDSKISFEQTFSKVTKVKFLVNNGLGNYVSCDEMEFFKKRNSNNELENQLLTVFGDLTCSELKEEATLEQITALPSYFASLATQLRNNTYDAWEKKFRIADYEPYSNVETWAEQLMTKRYSNLDNPTGIYAQQGDSVVVLVGDTQGQTITLQAIPTTEATGDIYFLKEGINKIGMKRTGMLYVMYTAALISPTAKPIRIHIPPQSGQVNGFFDLKKDKTDESYADLLSKATYKYFCVRGEKIMFYFHVSSLRSIAPRNILSAIHLWDNMIGWQQELMGIDDVRPSQVNNHVFAISLDADDDGYMWASDYRIAFNSTTLDRILLYDNVMARRDNIWGPAHEVGHVHQAAINWPGSTEASNNLFSNYAIYKLEKYCSRGSELSVLATQHCINKDAWIDMEGELKMRMYWQLWNYFHRCGYKPDFWQNLFKELRANRVPSTEPGKAQLHFAKMASKVANANLSDFFDTWGFFVPIDKKIEQYGTWDYVVTPAMIAEAKQTMATYPSPKHAFQYLEDRKNGDLGIEKYKVGDIGHYTAFKENRKITKKVTYTQSGQRITVQNGEEAVVFEIRANNNLLFFSNFLSFDLPESISLEGNSQLFAIQTDGSKIVITSK